MLKYPFLLELLTLNLSKSITIISLLDNDDRKLFVGGLARAHGVDERAITKYFQKFGLIQDVNFKRNPNGRPRGVYKITI